MARGNVELKWNDRRLRQSIHRMEQSIKGKKDIRRVARQAVKPWPKAVNGVVYSYIKRVTGKSKRAIGIETFEGRGQMVYGAKARPTKSKAGGGWRVHFFARPAKQISRGKRIPFRNLYAAKNGEVVRNVRRLFGELFKLKMK